MNVFSQGRRSGLRSELGLLEKHPSQAKAWFRGPLSEHSAVLVDERGVTYLMLLLSIVLIGISLSVAAKQWKTMVQRELEADLLAKGIEVQNAIALYSATKKAGRVVPGEIYPLSLEELTRQPKPLLRKVYQDPVGRGDWEYVRGPKGGIMGVWSRSKDRPIKQHGFPPAVRHFEGLSRYQDWIFQFPNASTRQLGKTTPTPQQGKQPSTESGAS